MLKDQPVAVIHTQAVLSEQEGHCLITRAHEYPIRENRAYTLTEAPYTPCTHGHSPTETIGGDALASIPATPHLWEIEVNTAQHGVYSKEDDGAKCVFFIEAYDLDEARQEANSRMSRLLDAAAAAAISVANDFSVSGTPPAPDTSIGLLTHQRPGPYTCLSGRSHP